MDKADSSCLTEEQRSYWQKLMEEDPARFEKPAGPHEWGCFDLTDLVEAVMHSCQNSQKAMMITAIEFFAKFSKGKEFCRQFGALLQKVKLIRVAGIRSMPFKDDRFGGFVAENYSAAAMLLPWMSLVVESQALLPPAPTATKPTRLPGPDKKLKDWTIKENTRYLQLINVKPESTKKQPLFEQVQRCRSDPNISEPVEPEVEEEPEESADDGNTARKEPPSTMRDFFLSAHLMYKMMLSRDLPGEQGRNRLLAHVMSFLSKWEKVDRISSGKKAKPIHISKYSSMGLLRCPDSFLEFELLRNLHEGGGALGEGVVKKLRSLSPTIARKNWSVNLVDAFYRQVTVEVLLRDLDQEDAPDGYESEDEAEIPHPMVFEDDGEMRSYSGLPRGGDRTRYRKYKAHSSEDGSETPSHPRRLVEAATPMSVTFYRKVAEKRESSELGVGSVLVGAATKGGLVPVKTSAEDGWQDPHGFLYLSVSVSSELVPYGEAGGISMDGFEIVGHGLCLPLLKDEVSVDSRSRRRCAFITDDWEWFDGNRLH